MASCLLWADLTPQGLSILSAAKNESELQAGLESLIEIENDPAKPLRKGCLLELYTNLLRFARDQEFNEEKTSTFFSIMKRNHVEMVNTLMPMDKSWEYCKV